MYKMLYRLSSCVDDQFLRSIDESHGLLDEGGVDGQLQHCEWPVSGQSKVNARRCGFPQQRSLKNASSDVFWEVDQDTGRPKMAILRVSLILCRSSNAKP